MKNFLMKLGVFSLFLLVVLAGYNYIHNDLIVNERKLNQIIKHFNDSGKNTEILVVGNSHPNWGLSHVHLPENTLNFTAAGMGSKEMYLMARFAISRAPSISLLVVQLDYFNFFGDGDSAYSKIDLRRIVSHKEYREAYQLSFFDSFLHEVLYQAPIFNPYYNDAAYKEYFRIGYNKLFGKNITQKRYYDLNMDVVQSNYKSIADYSPAFLESEAKRLSREHFYGKRESEDSIESIIKLVELANKKGIKVIGVRYPLSLAYQIEQERYNVKSIDDLLLRLDIQVIYDFTGVMDDRQFMFENPTHLNMTGRDVFSEILSDHLLTHM